jgi:hypothetical protein
VTDLIVLIFIEYPYHRSLMKSLFLMKACALGVIMISSMVVVLISHSTAVRADSINPGVYSKDSAPYGARYGEWMAKWWNWTMSIPKGDHPRDDYTPEKCQANQGGPVWFLADQLGGREERTCTIPAGKAILIPLLTGECGYDVPEIKNDEELRKCAMAGDEYGVVEATVDGVKLKDLESYRTQSGFFNTSQVDNNIYAAPAGSYRAFADGYFVFLEPPPVGKHDVNLKVSVLNPIETSYNYNADWTYHLDVVPSNSTGAQT